MRLAAPWVAVVVRVGVEVETGSTGWTEGRWLVRGGVGDVGVDAIGGDAGVTVAGGLVAGATNRERPGVEPGDDAGGASGGGARGTGVGGGSDAELIVAGSGETVALGSDPRQSEVGAG